MKDQLNLKNDSEIPPIVNNNEILHMDGKSKTNAFNEFFASVCNTDLDDSDLPFTKLLMNLYNKSLNSNFFLTGGNCQTLYHCIKRIPQMKMENIIEYSINTLPKTHL